MSNYIFDGKYGPIPNENREVDLNKYAANYIDDYMNITELPKENKEYLDEVFTNYKVINMENMFCLCMSIEYIDVSKWDTRYVTNMNSVFYGCRNIKELDVSNWDTGNVTNMNSMFACCLSLNNIKGISEFNTSNVIDMGKMFFACLSNKHIDVHKWDVNKVKNFKAMFFGCDSNIIRVSSWNTSLAEYMCYTL